MTKAYNGRDYPGQNIVFQTVKHQAVMSETEQHLTALFVHIATVSTTL